MTPRELAERWREDACTLERYDVRLAAVVRRQADELDAALRSEADDVLDLAAASKESGYSAERLRHMLAEGRLPNAGKKGAPRIRRGDLLRKRPSRRGTFDATETARSIVQLEHGGAA